MSDDLKNIERIPLRADALMATASAQEGLADFGDTAFIEPLQQFIGSVATEGRLSAMGLIGFRMDLLRLLSNRLRMYRDLALHPEIRDEDVRDPLLITGNPRTGSTLLHRLIAQDPQFQSLPLWRALFVAPLPGTDPADPAPRRAMAAGMAEQLASYFPDVLAGHAMQPDEAEEEVLLLQLSFETAANAWFYRAPSYHDWVTRRAPLASYHNLKLQLQYLQWQDGGRRNRPWVLKSPIHLANLSTVLAIFPGATVVHCHREPYETVPSLCRLIEVIRQSRGHEDIDLPELGRYFSDFGAAQWAANLAQRKELHQSDTRRVLDTGYAAICRDPIAVLHDIYRSRDSEPSQTALTQMQRWQAANPQGRYGEHRYSLDRYGLSRADIDLCFADYRKTFSASLGR